jgi:hypothetical protein
LKLPEGSLPIGSPLPNPDLKMKSINGKEVSFKDEMNKNGLLVMFSCNTYPEEYTSPESIGFYFPELLFQDQ